MALSEVRLERSDGIPLAVVRRQARAAELSKVVPEACGVVWSFVRSRNLGGGRNVAVYLDGAIHLEVGVECAAPLPEGGDVVSSATPAGPVASVAHFGPYHQLGTAHRAVQEWCAAHRHRLAGPNWEIYGHWQDAWNADPSQIRTDVCYQLMPDGATAG